MDLIVPAYLQGFETLREKLADDLEYLFQHTYKGSKRRDTHTRVYMVSGSSIPTRVRNKAV